MKFKLDENIGRRGLELLKACGHDVMTVWDQGLHGVADARIWRRWRIPDLALSERLELPTLGFEVRCSIQL